MISNLLIGIGLLLVVIGTIGILRFRDVYSRLQASGVSDNAGLGLVLVGLIIRDGLSSHDLRLGLLLAILLFINPVITHSIAKSAFAGRHGSGDDRT
jgi:multicomponent Na+:H+ antiporter subunit G